MKTFLKNFLMLSFFAVSVLLISCGEDDNPTPSGEYASGVFVINEGNFGDGDGSISFYTRESEEVEQTIFQSVNDEQALGDVIQSAYSHNGLTYLIANNSNKVEVVNSFTFETQFAITDVELPRYMTVAGGRGYLTEWVSFTAPGKVSVFNLETGVIEQEIEVGSLPEDIEVIGDKIYVTEAFGSPNLYIVDLANGNSVTTLTPGNGSNQLVSDADGNLWVACGGGFDENFSPLGDGLLVKINPDSDQVMTSIELNTNYGGKLGINNAGTQIYFYAGNAVYNLSNSFLYSLA